MPSFDVVSEINAHELQNAVDQANREIENRFDFKNSQAHLEHNDQQLTFHAQNEFQIEQMWDVLRSKLAKRGVDVKALTPGEVETANQRARQPVTVRQGLNSEEAKEIVKAIKNSKIKVQAAIQGEQVRVTGKKRDDLQQTISLLRELPLELPLQFTNFRD